jgi:hypothetical protein
MFYPGIDASGNRAGEKPEPAAIEEAERDG